MLTDDSQVKDVRSQPDKVKSPVKAHHPTISQPQQMSSAPFREVSSRLSPSYWRADREETNEWGATGEVSFMKCTCVLPGLLSLSPRFTGRSSRRGSTSLTTRTYIEVCGWTELSTRSRAAARLLPGSTGVRPTPGAPKMRKLDQRWRE